MRIERRWLPALAACFLLTACDSEGDQGDVIPPGERNLALWSELLEDDEVQGELSFLAEHGLDLYLAVHAERVGDPDLAALIRQANEAEVGVRAWLLLPQEDGYWANEHNVDGMRQLAEDFDDFRKAEDLDVDWLIFDMETSYERTLVLNDAPTDEAYALRMLEGVDGAAFQQAHEAYGSLIEDLHGRGLKVMAVTFPQLLEDAGDCDVNLQDAYDIPLTGLPWDEVSFMIYTSAFSASFDDYFDADLVQVYADLAVEQFGDRASVALGIVGEAGVLPVPFPYRNAGRVLDDRAAAHAAGIERISLFALDGIREQDDPARWVQPSVEPMRADVGEDVAAVREALQNLDDFLGEGTCP